jgi:flagellin
MLQRIRELAVQSSNSSNSSSDRKALQTEVSQLTSELNRVASTTQFNGQNLLDGTMGTANFQVGANANQLISMTGANFSTNTYGNNTSTNLGTTAVVGADPITGGTLTINGTSGTADITIAASSSAKLAAAAINNKSGDTGVTASAQTNAMFQSGTGGGSFTLAVTADNDPTTSPVTVAFQVGSNGDTADDYAAAISAFNAQTAKTGVTASYDATNKGLKLTNANGSDISLVSKDAAPAAATFSAYTATGTSDPATGAAVDATGALAKGAITLDSSQAFSTSDASGFSVAATSDLKKVSDIDVSTFDGAQQAIKIADAALSKVDDQRSQLGALQSRFDSTISNLQSTNQNLSASKSRIVDTDFASETANMTRGQILQQAGTSMLAQANSLPNGVLSLLRG